MKVKLGKILDVPRETGHTAHDTRLLLLLLLTLLVRSVYCRVIKKEYSLQSSREYSVKLIRMVFHHH
jgi:hypothetical protein